MDKFMMLIGIIAILGGFFGYNYYTSANKRINIMELSNTASIPTIDVSAPDEYETATFALGCFWSPDALFGSTFGVIRTRVGYAGGKEDNPTYRSIGGHTESIQIDYDPSKISYNELLEIFWNNHDPTYQHMSQQYKSIIFYHNMGQRDLAYETKSSKEVELNETIYTEIRSFTEFYLAEEYHQKYKLRQEKLLMKEFQAMYTDTRAFIDSTAVARVNGYIAGYGDYNILQEELSNLGLSKTAQEYLVESFNKRKGDQHC